MAFDPTSYPFDTVVMITDTIGGLRYQGSGVLISPDEVLTASHVLYVAGVGTASDIVVTPASGPGGGPYGSARGTYFHYSEVADANNLILPATSQSDYAVIHLSSSFVANGTMGLLADFAGGAVTVAGYPASASGTMVASPQTVARDPRYALLNGTSLGKGSSGGPVFVGGASGPQVVGVVSSESGTVGRNTLITTAAFNQIAQWVASDDAGRTWVNGTHSQYLIANAGGTLYYQDLVANRNGAATRTGVDQIVFTDGAGRFDPTGNAEEVARLYDSAFGRGSDLAGLDWWTRQIDSGALQIGSVAMAFIQSPEFQSRYGSLDNQGFVRGLYQNDLHRGADAAGLAYWTDALNAGLSRGALLVGFSDSFEHKRDMLPTVGDKDMAETYRLYQAAFGRTADPGGLASWTGVLDSGTGVADVAAAFAGSAEFAATFAGLDAAGQVNQLYENTFHRGADAAGTGFWLGQLQGGMSMSQMLLSFSDSQENRVATAGATHDAWVYTAG
jgi:V8-like Glu-specific endopeptidase